MSKELEEKLKEVVVDNRLQCPVAFEVAKELKITPREVGDKANELGIKIAGCQLGCFK